MIEAASLAHGVRNALSEENRAKISYEIKRELIRVRKDRKIEVKEALREYRAKHRAPVDPTTGEGE
jgi:propanediol dehydratase small subunit